MNHSTTRQRVLGAMNDRLIDTHRRAFTLIELIVVVAIVAVLVNLLLPVLGGAKENGRAAVCGSNIRQLTLANSAYAVDQKEHYVPAAEDLFVGLGGRKRWHGQRNSAGVSSNPQDNIFDPHRSPLRGYIGGQGRVKQCPTFTDAVQDGAVNAFEAGTGGYGYNHQYIGGRNDLYGFTAQAASTTAQTSDPAQPSHTVMFTDVALAQQQDDSPYLIEYSFCEPPFWQMTPGTPSTFATNPTIHFRHHDSANVAWTDGHVSIEKMTFSGPYMFYGMTQTTVQEMGFGWFGPESNQYFDLQ